MTHEFVTHEVVTHEFVILQYPATPCSTLQHTLQPTATSFAIKLHLCEVFFLSSETMGLLMQNVAAECGTNSCVTKLCVTNWQRYELMCHEVMCHEIA